MLGWSSSLVWLLGSLVWAGPPSEAEVVETASAEPIEPAPGPAPEPPERRGRGRFVEPPNLHVHWEVDAPLMLGAGAIWLGTELALDQLVPSAPRWTQATAGDLAIREALIWRSPRAARSLSNVFTLAVVPLLGLGLTLADVGSTRQWRYLHEDLAIVFEAVTVAGALTQAIKLGTARGRPYTYEVYDDPTDVPVDQLLVAEPDAFVSFPSAHTSFAFAFTAGLATVATMRERKLAPVLWGVGMPASAFVAYLRVAGHRHWFSDVVIGSTIGTIVGAGLPLLLHHPRFGLLARLTARKRSSAAPSAELRVIPTGDGASVIGQF